MFDTRSQLCAPLKKRMHDPLTSFDDYDETEDTEEKARCLLLAKQIDRARKV